MLFLLLLFLNLTAVQAAPHLSEMTVQGQTETPYTTTISKKSIQQKQYQNAVSLFKAHPSLEIKNVGGSTSLFVRGANSAHNIVILNGLVINDPSSNNQFDFSALDPNDIEKIEIITGAKALYYGSGALGGVIKITTKKAQKKTLAKGRFEVGSFDTRKAHLTLGHRTKALGLLGTVNTGCSGPKTRWNHHHQLHNADRHSATAGSLFLDAKPTSKYQVDLFLQGEKSKTHLNDFIDRKIQASGAQSFQYNNRAILRNSLTLLEGRWQQSLTIGLQNNRRKTLSLISGTYISQRQSLDYENEFDVTNWITLQGGLNYSKESDHSHHTPGKTLGTKSLRSKINFLPFENLDVFIAGRLDKHDRFQTHPTWQTGLSWDITQSTLLEASLGTGFKAPSIQTFVGSNTLQVPNKNAKPEKSFLWDLSLKQFFFQKKLQAKVTYFMNKIKDLLVWDLTSERVINKNERTIRGIEFSLNYRFNKHWEITTSFTYLRAFDREPAMRALNIPPYKTTFTLMYAPTKKLSFFTETVHKSRQMNYDNKRIKAITDMRLGGRYRWQKNIELFGRVENVLNQKIEESYGYGRRGLGVFGGIILKT